MKKSIERLLKNEIFRKISMVVLFVFMCFFGCFSNSKAAADTKHFQLSSAVSSGAITKFEMKNSADNDTAGWSDINLGTSISFDDTQPLKFRITGNNLNSSISLLYSHSNYEQNVLADKMPADSSIYFTFSPGAFDGTGDNYNLKLLDKGYSFHTGCFKVPGNTMSQQMVAKNAYNKLYIEYSLNDGSSYSPLPTITMPSSGNAPDWAQHITIATGETYYRPLYFEGSKNVKLLVTGKGGFSVNNLKYSEDLSSGTSGVLWDGGNNDWNRGQGHTVNGEGNLYFDGLLTFKVKSGEGENVTLADKVKVEYKLGENGTYADFPSDNNNYYTSVETTIGDQIYIKLKAKDGYDISGLEYAINSSGYNNWGDPSSELGFGMSGDVTLWLRYIKKKVAINPNYYNGISMDPAYLYRALELKYKLNNERDYHDWPKDEGSTKYTSLNVLKGTAVEIRAKLKNGYSTEDKEFMIRPVFKYKYYNTSDPDAYDGETLLSQAVTRYFTHKISSIDNNDKNLVFSNITSATEVTITPAYKNESYSDPDNDPDKSFYEACKLEYTKSTLNPGPNAEWTEWTAENGKYTAVSVTELSFFTNVYVRISEKPGYTLTNTNYLFYPAGTEDDQGNPEKCPVGTPIKLDQNGGSYVLKFGGDIHNKIIQANFDINKNDLPDFVIKEDVLKVCYAGSGTPNYTQNMEANTNHTVQLDFSNCDESMKNSFNTEKITLKDKNDRFLESGEYEFTNGKWSESEMSYSFDVMFKTSKTPVYFTIGGIVLRKMDVRFLRGDDKLINVSANGDASYTWSDDGIVTWPKEGNDSIKYGQEFKFYLKPIAYGAWLRPSKDDNTNYALNELIESGLEGVRGATCSYSNKVQGEPQNCYIVTIPALKTDLKNVKLKSDCVKIHRINFSFENIRLPNDANHNGVEISQDGAKVAYPERASTDIYTLKAQMTSTVPTGEITISIPSTENFKFESQSDEKKDFTINYGVSNSVSVPGAIKEEGKKVTFEIPIEAVQGLHDGDIDISCNCLIPGVKNINFKLNGGVTANVYNNVTKKLFPISIKTEEGGIETKDNINIVSDDSHFIMAKYGDWVDIRYSLNEGNVIDDPEQVHLYKVSQNTADKELVRERDWNIEIDNDKRGTITFVGDLLQCDVKIVFNSDKDNIPIEFKNVDGLNYYALSITKDESGMIQGFDESNPFEFTNTGDRKNLKGIVTVPTGNDYYFAVNVDAGYDLNSLKITQNGREPEVPSGTQQQDSTGSGDGTYQFIEYKFKTVDAPEGFKFYKLIKVTSNVTISGSVNKKTLEVEFKKKTKVDGTSSEYATISYKRDNVNIGNDKLNIVYGNAAVFTVSLPEKYSQSNFKVWVRNKDQTDDQGVEVTKYQNEYRILNIDENKVVYVTDVTINKYVVNFVGSDKADYLIGDEVITDPKTVLYASELEFKIRPKTGYKLDNTVAVNCVTVGGDAKSVERKPSGSGENVIYKCKITNIMEDRTIRVDNISNITYKVSFQDVPGATYLNDKSSVISGKVTVGYGKNFEFGVNIDDSYDDSAAGMFIILNDGKTKLHAQKLSSGRYMIPNITEDVKIRVGNIRKNTYTVTLRNEEGIDYYNSSDKIITGDNTVEHGGSLAFRVGLYPAYSDSSITVMLGKDKMTPDSSGYYNISGVVENKIVTVTGIHPNAEVDLVNTINNLPSSINDLNDVNSVIEASRWYNSLSDEQKANVSNADVLMRLQQQAGEILHRSNDVTIDGADWYIKLVVVPISSDMDACARIYKKLNSEYILSLYDIYLWDTLNDVRYIPNGDQMYTVTIPAPKLKNFRNPTGVHEDSNSGKVSFMDLSFNGDTVSFQTNSFSPMGVVASHDPTGASSLFDAAGVNLDWINDYVFGSASRGPSDRRLSDGTLVDDGDDNDGGNNDQNIGNIDDKFRSINNRVTPQGSALRLILVSLILILLALAIWIIYKKRKEDNENK